jgi:hypothetical protein
MREGDGLSRWIRTGPAARGEEAIR